MSLVREEGSEALTSAPGAQAGETGSGSDTRPVITDESTGSDAGDRCETAPQANNIGVLNTSVVDREPSGMILDYLCFTLHGGYLKEHLRFVENLIGKIEPLDHGMYGYAECGAVLETGRVAWSPRLPDRGVFVSLPATALAELWDYHYDTQELLDFLRAFGATFTRLDLAVDDTRGLLEMDVIREMVEDESCVSRFRQIGGYEGLRGTKGNTVYFGSPKSDSRCRIYDKREEQIDSGHECDLDHWVRCEYQFRKERADKMAQELIDKGPSFFLGVALSYIDFKERGTDTNKSRWATCEWWQGFLGGAVKQPLSMAREKSRTIGDKKNWLLQQVSGVYVEVLEVDSSFGDTMGYAGRAKLARRARQSKTVPDAERVETARGAGVRAPQGETRIGNYLRSLGIMGMDS